LYYKELMENKMPNSDGTGPQGKGAMTGRKRGNCLNSNKTQIADPENQNIEENGVASGEENGVASGLGQGGKPHGCGRGKCFGGGNGHGRGAGNT
jgi:hypothetical protein